MRFAKYQALGNDYLVVEAEAVGAALGPGLAIALCHRHTGVGSDGLLVSEAPGPDGSAGLRILNPDGSEAEKSGNGLRIHARYLFERGRVGDAPFEVRTAGGRVRCRVLEGGRLVSVEMGRVSFRSADVPVSGADREVLREPLAVVGGSIEICAATLGNPHCVVLGECVSPERARELGPELECHASFPERTNVQLLEVRGRHAIGIEIWERGAGYTLASGSSACASAAVAVRLGLCDSPVAVHMQGGELRVEIDAEFFATQVGPVGKVAEGELSAEFLARL
jgi:diaminopimelate epimerase